MKLLLAVAAGGAIGSAARYLVMAAIGSMGGAAGGLGFPWATLTVNVAGAFALGALVETFALIYSPGPEMRAFLVVGILGGFTTFSTFSLDIVTLHERGEFLALAGYVIVSVAASVAALFAGLAMMRTVLSA